MKIQKNEQHGTYKERTVVFDARRGHKKTRYLTPAVASDQATERESYIADCPRASSILAVSLVVFLFLF